MFFGKKLTSEHLMRNDKMKQTSLTILEQHHVAVAELRGPLKVEEKNTTFQTS